MPQILPVRTRSTLHFAGAIAAGGAAAVEHLRTVQDAVAAGLTVAHGVVPEGLAAGRHVRSKLKSIRILSVQLLPWELQLFGSAAGIASAAAAIDSEFFIGTWSFAGSGAIGDGSRAIGDTLYYFYVDGLDVPYEDHDLTSQIHLRLVNRHAATAKIAGVNGGISIELGMELWPSR